MSMNSSTILEPVDVLLQARFIMGARASATTWVPTFCCVVARHFYCEVNPVIEFRDDAPESLGYCGDSAPCTDRAKERFPGMNNIGSLIPMVAKIPEHSRIVTCPTLVAS